MTYNKVILAFGLTHSSPRIDALKILKTNIEELMIEKLTQEELEVIK